MPRSVIREFRPDDLDAVVELSVRAWAPVFTSLAEVLGSGLFAWMHPDGWPAAQRKAVAEACRSEGTHVWVAEVGTAVAGFVAVRFDPAESTGEIHMIAVDPPYQQEGVGSRLTEFALDRMRERGMALALVETGGDLGHAPARRTYERAGFTPLPIVRYFRRL